MLKARLILSNGVVFEGKGVGFEGVSYGEVVFNTGMTGYQEALTDPSYAGQILCFTFPLIGNYGVGAGFNEGKRVHASGVVVSQASDFYNHPTANQSLHEFLRENKTGGICGIDTRRLTRIIREFGVMPSVLEVVKESASFNDAITPDLNCSTNFVEKVAGVETQTYSQGEPSKRVVLVDCGVKQGILNGLIALGCEVVVVPWNASSSDILKYEPDGIVLSNGPGDPAVVKKTVDACKEYIESKPVLGICLGHQVIAQALGGSTFKLKFGHRGGNHAVRNVENNKTFITSHNHGYSVKLPNNCKEWFVNCLDGSNEGLKHESLPVSSVQFHPEARPGPFDSQWILSDFVKSLK